MYLYDRQLRNYWALDIETDALDASRIHVCCVENLSTGDKRTITTAEEFRLFKQSGFVYVTHNGLSFDIPVLNRLWGTKIRLSRVVDTLVLSYLYNPNLPRPAGYTGGKGPHSLDCWGYRLGDYKIGFHDWSKLTDEMIEYCQQDVSITCELYRRLSQKLVDLGYSEESALLEHKFRTVINDQERNGFKFNRTRANFLYLRLRSMEYETQATIRSFFKPKEVLKGEYAYREKANGEPFASYLRHCEESPKIVFNKDKTRYRTFTLQEFNIGSPVQRLERLLDLGWKPKKKTKSGKNWAVDEESVVEFATSSGNKYVGLIADWLVYNGRANMIRTWLNELQEDSCIHGSVSSCGAGSRRCTHSAPNTANIPSVYARFGVESRSLWVARPERVLVGADASGLEGRVFIHYLGSEEAKTFMLGDPHTENANAISRAVGFEVSRSSTKNLFYARLYGASDKKLGSMLGGNRSLGEKVRSAIDTNIPGFESLVQSIGQEYEKNGGRLQTVDGGFVSCPSPHAALNYKFQSCGALIMKQAAILLSDRIRKEGLDCLKVGDIHDEWQFDVAPTHAERVGDLACRAMTQAGKVLNLNIKIEGEYKIGRNWAETH